MDIAMVFESINDPFSLTHQHVYNFNFTRNKKQPKLCYNSLINSYSVNNMKVGSNSNRQFQNNLFIVWNNHERATCIQ